MATALYKEISAIARKRRAANIEAFYPDIPTAEEAKLPQNLRQYALSSGFYTTDELEIIQSEAEDILQKIRDGIWTAVEVTSAFCKASAYAQSLVRSMFCV